MNSDDKILVVTDILVVWAFVGSSVRNIDLISSSEYPFPRTHMLSPYSLTPHPVRAGYVAPLSADDSPPVSEADATPSIVVTNSKGHLHTRPAELYLGAESSRGRLHMYTLYDRNVFEEGVVEEWPGEGGGAVLWYLGQTHHWSSRGSVASRDRRTGRGQGVRTKL